MKGTIILFELFMSTILVSPFGHIILDEVSPDCTFTNDTYPNNEIHVNCPELVLQIYLNNKHVTFMCFEETSNLNVFSSVSGLRLVDDESYTVSFLECRLPNTSFRAVLDDIGLKKVKGLQIKLHKTYNDRLGKNHLINLRETAMLDLSSNELTLLTSDILEEMTNLTRLNLRNNNIYLQKGLFKFTPTLESLEIGQNKIVYLEAGVFKYLQRLKYLNLWGNKLENITRTVFTDVPNLESLDLSSNKLKTLEPDTFFDLIKLKKLNLFANWFTRLPPNLLQKNQLLEEFQMHWNKGHDDIIPVGFLSNLTALKSARLSACKLKSLPEDTFTGSKKLERLYINGNSLTTFAKKLFVDLESLVYLDISQNQIESLPDDLFINTKKLKTLKINNNKLGEITSKMFIGLRDLEYLDLRSNNVEEIREGFFEMENLKVLNISDNKLTTLASDLQIDNIEKSSALQGCLKLEDLQLANNSLTEIYTDWRLLLPSLHTLNMASNNITSVEMNDFCFLGGASVDVSNNQIKTVYFHGNNDGCSQVNSSTELGYRNSVTAKLIKLENNPFNCDCAILDFVRFLRFQLGHQVTQTFQSRNLICSEPERLRNKPLNMIPYKLLTCELKFDSSTSARPTGCSYHYRSYSYNGGIIMNCQNSQLKKIPPIITHSEIPNMNFSELNIQGNYLETFELPVGGYSKVTHFNISNNSIYFFSSKGISDKIKELDISNNNLTMLNDETVDFLNTAADLQLLEIHGNPWDCDCYAKPLIRLIKNRYKLVRHIQNVTCSDGTLIEKLEESELCSTNVIIVICVICASIGVFIATSTSLYYHYQAQIHIYCFSSKWKVLRWLVSSPDPNDEKKKYDAFVSFSQEDELFVAEKLAPGLENNKDNRFKLCLHYRDWTPGESILNQIFHSVQSSHRTIVVLSPSFLKSEWGKAEFRTAHAEGMRDGKPRVIVVLYKDVNGLEIEEDLKAYLQMNTYVKWGSPWFWQQLKYALPHPQEARDHNDIQCALCCALRPRIDSSTHEVLQNVKLKNGEVYFGVNESSNSSKRDDFVG